MPYQVEKTGELSCVASVVVPAEEFRRSYHKALKELSQRVRLSGFRQGKVPMAVMKKNYGGAVLNDVLEELINASMQTILDETEGVLFLAQPEVDKLPTEETGLEYKVAFELRPQVDPVGYMGIEVGKPEVQIEDSAVEAKLEGLRKEHATLVPVEGRDEIQEGDSVTLDFKGLGDHPEVERLSGEGVSIVVGSKQSLPGIEEALVGVKFGATTVAKITLNDSFPVEELRGQEIELELSIKEVKREALPELDDEFAQDTGRGQTLEQVRQSLREELAEQKEAEAKQIAEEKLIDALLAQHTFEVPPRFLEQQVYQLINDQLGQLKRQGIDPSMLGLNYQSLLEDMRPSRERQIKTEFILMAIAEKENVSVQESDFKAFIQEQAARVGATVAQYERFVRGDKDRTAQALGSIRLQKTVDLLLKEASFVSIPWPAAEQASQEAAQEEAQPGQEG